MRDIMAQIYEIEEKEAEVLTEFMFDDFWLWTSIRIHLWTMITPDIQTRASGKRTKPIKIRFINFLKMILNLKEYIKLLFMRKSDVLLFTYKQYRRDFIDGQHRDVYFSHLIEHMESRGIKYSIVSEDEDTFYRLKIRERKYVLFRQPFLFISKVLTRVSNIKKQTPEKLLHLAQELQQRHNLPFVNALYKAIGEYITKRRINKRFIDKISPKYVFMVPSINKEALIAVCKKRGVTTIEGEHGTFVPILHRYPENLKTNVKDKNLITQAPDYYLCFGKNTHNELVKDSLIAPANVRTIGNPRIDFFKKRNRETTKRNSGITKRNSGKDETDENINVLLTSQYTVTDELIEFFRGVNKELNSKNINNVKISVKLHFDEFHRYNDWKMEESAHLTVFGEDAEKSEHLFEMMLESDFLASVYSTTLTESISLERPTIILKLWGWDAYKDYVEQGIVIPVDTPEQFIDKILEYNSDEDKIAELTEKMSEFNALVNTPNAIENYRAFFDEIYKI